MCPWILSKRGSMQVHHIACANEDACIAVPCKRLAVCSDKMMTMQEVPFSLEDRLKERGAKYEKV